MIILHLGYISLVIWKNDILTFNSFENRRKSLAIHNGLSDIFCLCKNTFIGIIIIKKICKYILMKTETIRKMA